MTSPAIRPGPLQPSPERLRMALDLYPVGVDLQRQRLRRAHPDESDEQIEARLLSWRLREGEPCDGEGKTIPWPRPPR